MIRAVLAILSLTALAACGGGAPEEEAEAYIRLPASGANMAAAYLTVSREQDDRLIAAEVEGIRTTELHTVTSDNGVMQMRPVEGYEVAAGSPLVLKPGGDHLMLIGIEAPLTEGETRTVTLRFESGATQVLELPVKGRR